MSNFSAELKKKISQNGQKISFFCLSSKPALLKMDDLFTNSGTWEDPTLDFFADQLRGMTLPITDRGQWCLTF